MPDTKGTTEAFIDRLEARAYSRATEVPERVDIALLNIFPESIRDRVSMTVSATEGHLGLPIRIHTAILDSRKLAVQALSEILSKLSADELQFILKTLERRIDEECTLFLRIDKQAAYLENTKLAMDPDVISLQIRIMKWPRCQTNDAEHLIRQLISDTGVLGDEAD